MPFLLVEDVHTLQAISARTEFVLVLVPAVAQSCASKVVSDVKHRPRATTHSSIPKAQSSNFNLQPTIANLDSKLANSSMCTEYGVLCTEYVKTK